MVHARGMIDFLVLRILKKGEKCGYEIIDEIKEITDGAIEPKTGTIYPLLSKLEDDGIIKVSKEEKCGRRRKYYKLTSNGLKTLEEKKKNFKQMEEKSEKIMKAFRKIAEKNGKDDHEFAVEMNELSNKLFGNSLINLKKRFFYALNDYKKGKITKKEIKKIKKALEDLHKKVDEIIGK